MRIIKCDACKKKIDSLENIIRVEIRRPDYLSFEICCRCGGPIIKILKNKKLVQSTKASIKR